MSFGAMAAEYPSLEDSFRRRFICAIGRTSPESASSPKMTASVETGFSAKADTRAAATARSAPGSLRLYPPETLRRSEERRVGKGWVGTVRLRWAGYH